MEKVSASQEKEYRGDLRSFLSQEFEEKFGHLKDKLEENQYADFKDKWIEDEVKIACELEESNAMHEEAKEEVKKERVDLITGLEKDKAFFGDLNQKAEEYLGIEGNVSAREWVKEFVSKTEELKSYELSVMAADMSYLNIVNSISHQEGDKMLGKMGKAFLDNHDRCYRIHGDEFAGIFEEGKEAAEEKMNQIERDFESGKMEALEEKYGLKPSVDWAVVGWPEAVDIFKQALEDEEVKKLIIQKGRPLKAFVDSWYKVADIKALHEKARARIPLLVQKHKTNPELQEEFAGHLYKGAYNISQEDVSRLSQVWDDEGSERMKEEVENFIADREKKIIEGLVKEEEEAWEERDFEKAREKRLERMKREAAMEI